MFWFSWPLVFELMAACGTAHGTWWGLLDIYGFGSSFNNYGDTWQRRLPVSVTVPERVLCAVAMPTDTKNRISNKNNLCINVKFDQ